MVSAVDRVSAFEVMLEPTEGGVEVCSSATGRKLIRRLVDDQSEYVKSVGAYRAKTHLSELDSVRIQARRW